MKHIKIYIGSDIIEKDVPGSWREVPQHDFANIVSSNVSISGIPIFALQILLGIEDDDARWITPDYWLALSNEFTFVSDYSKIDSWLVESIELSDGRKCYPPAADFDNVSWEEFVFADQLAQVDNWKAVAATLFRPLREAATEEEDPRIPFTRYGLNSRLGLFSDLDPSVILAVKVNYLALRQRMTKKYRNIFAGSAGSEGQGWPEVSRQVLGNEVWQEEQLAKTSVNGVLAMIDNTIKTNKQRERDERRSRNRH